MKRLVTFTSMLLAAAVGLAQLTSLPAIRPEPPKSVYSSVSGFTTWQTPDVKFRSENISYWAGATFMGRKYPGSVPVVVLNFKAVRPVRLWDESVPVVLRWHGGPAYTPETITYAKQLRTDGTFLEVLHCEIPYDIFLLAANNDEIMVTVGMAQETLRGQTLSPLQRLRASIE